MRCLIFLLSFLVGCGGDRELFQDNKIVNEKDPLEILPFEGLKSSSKLKYSSVILSWDAHPDASEYLIYQDGVKLVSTNNLEFKVDGLQAESEYLFKVHMKDQEGFEVINDREITIRTLSFNSYSLQISAADSVELFEDLPGSFTFGIWFKSSESDQMKLILMENTDGITGFSIILGSGVYFVDKNGKKAEIEHRVNYGDESWHQIVVTHDRKILKLYIDGVDVGEASSDIGSFNGSPLILGNGFSGQVDEVALFPRALREREIFNLYSNRLLKGTRNWIRMGDEPLDHDDLASDRSGATYSLSGVSYFLDAP